MNTIALIVRLGKYFSIFLRELVVANIEVTQAVLSPRFKFKTAAIKFQSKMKTKAELLMITNSITLTPGTLVMDSNLKTGEILIHVMSKDSLDRIRKSLQRFPEDEVLKAIRGEENA